MLFLFFLVVQGLVACFLKALLFRKIGSVSFNCLLYSHWLTWADSHIHPNDCSNTSVCHTSPKIYCGEPQTPQEDVAIERRPHCRHWKCEKGLVSKNLKDSLLLFLTVFFFFFSKLVCVTVAEVNFWEFLSSCNGKDIDIYRYIYLKNGSSSKDLPYAFQCHFSSIHMQKQRFDQDLFISF